MNLNLGDGRDRQSIKERNEESDACMEEVKRQRGAIGLFGSYSGPRRG